jgi:restriction system protein
MARKTFPLVNAKDLTLSEWLKHALTEEHDRTIRIADYQFPTDKHRDDYLAQVHLHTEPEVRALLRRFLMASGTLGKDDYTRRYINSLPHEERHELVNSCDFARRLVEPPFLPWEGITWVLDLLPHYPSKALDALDAYFVAHCQFLPDGRIHGMSDAEAIIRRRYLQWQNPREALLTLRPDEFECLVGALYEKLGYEVTVTQSSRDGGIDVEAIRNEAGRREFVLLQCKRYTDVVRVPAVRELMGVVARRQANKGVLIATCGYTSPARQEAAANPMIELIDFPALNQLLNRHMGSKWPDHMGHEIRRVQMAQAKTRA